MQENSQLHQHQPFQRDDSLSTGISSSSTTESWTSLSAPISPLTTPNSSAGLKQAQATQLSYDVTLDMYRQNAKKSNDPQTQLEFAKYLIQLAEAIPVDPTNSKTKKAHDTLLSEGIKWIKRLASNGRGLGRPAYAEAQFFLAECHGNGLFGLNIDHDRAFELYVQASKQNHPAATYRSAVCYEIGAGPRKDYGRSVLFYRKAAALGDPCAMFKLAMILIHGSMNTPRNEREGVSWLKRAVEIPGEEYPDALHELAIIYENGNVPSIIGDELYARELYTKAAKAGYAPSQFKLGYCFEYGKLTCEIDATRSIAWYSRAAESGHVEAELALSGWYLNGSPGVLDQSDEEAFRWAFRAAEKAFSKAEYAVAYYYEVGIGVEKSMEEAVKWYTRAASQGNERAAQRLRDINDGVSSNGSSINQRRRGKKDSSECCIM